MKVIQIIPKLEFAGAEIMCENLCYSIKQKGIDVLVVSLYNQSTIITERLIENGIKIIFLDKNPGIDLSIIKQLYKIFLLEKPDAVHSHINVLQYVAFAAYFARVKICVHTVHSIATKEATGMRQNIYYFLFRLFNIIPVALSDEVKMSVIDRYRLPADKIPVIYNGIDLERCIPKKSYESQKGLTFLHIGRFADVKNHKMIILSFIKVLEAIPDAKLKLIGSGSNYEMIREMVKENGIEDNVDFLGIQPVVFNYLNEADVFILPSIYEGMPMTLIEAMGTALPIIASNVGGIPSMLTNDVDSLLIDVNEKELISAMIKMNDINLRRRLGTEALKRSREFSADVMASKYIQIYSRKFNI